MGLTLTMLPKQSNFYRVSVTGYIKCHMGLVSESLCHLGSLPARTLYRQDMAQGSTFRLTFSPSCLSDTSVQCPGNAIQHRNQFSVGMGHSVHLLSLAPTLTPEPVDQCLQDYKKD